MRIVPTPRAHRALEIGEGSEFNESPLVQSTSNTLRIERSKRRNRAAKNNSRMKHEYMQCAPSGSVRSRSISELDVEESRRRAEGCSSSNAKPALGCRLCEWCRVRVRDECARVSCSAALALDSCCGAAARVSFVIAPEDTATAVAPLYNHTHQCGAPLLYLAFTLCAIAKDIIRKVDEQRTHRQSLLC